MIGRKPLLGLGGEAPNQSKFVFLFAKQAGLVDDIELLKEFGVSFAKHLFEGLRQASP